MKTFLATLAIIGTFVFGSLPAQACPGVAGYGRASVTINTNISRDCADLKYRHNGATHYPDDRYQGRGAVRSGGQAVQMSRYSYRSEMHVRQSRSSNRHRNDVPRVNGAMPKIDAAAMQQEIQRALGPVNTPPGVGYHFNVAADADTPPKANCRVIKTSTTSDGMYNLVRRVCPN